MQFNLNIINHALLYIIIINNLTDLISEENFLLLSDKYNSKIYQTSDNFDGKKTFSALKIPIYQKPMALAYDYKNKVIFWSDNAAWTNYYMNLNGNQIEYYRYQSIQLVFKPLKYIPFLRI